MRASKRLFDLTLTIPGTALILPVMAAVAAAIRLEDGGPVFFRQERIGQGGRPFKVWKFRTMKVDAGGEPITLARDPRVTRVGAVLRRYRLDELPQVFNVLSGEMSLVGPRPEVAKYVAHYTAEQRAALEFVPGITDPAMIKLRAYRTELASRQDLEGAYIHEVMPEKLRISIEYARSANALTDLKVIFETLAVAARS